MKGNQCTDTRTDNKNRFENNMEHAYSTICCRTSDDDRGNAAEGGKGLMLQQILITGEDFFQHVGQIEAIARTTIILLFISCQVSFLSYTLLDESQCRYVMPICLPLHRAKWHPASGTIAAKNMSMCSSDTAAVSEIGENAAGRDVISELL